VDETKPVGSGPAKKTGEPKRNMGPFDHPWFLPGLLFAFALWFGYDGWLNPKIKAVTFNRVLAPLWLVGGIYYSIQNIRDQRRARERAGQSSPTQPG
jgi:hypothetical protein